MEKEQSLPEQLTAYESLNADFVETLARLDRVLSVLAGKGFPPQPATQARTGNTLQDRLAVANDDFSTSLNALKYGLETLEGALGMGIAGSIDRSYAAGAQVPGTNRVR